MSKILFWALCLVSCQPCQAQDYEKEYSNYAKSLLALKYVEIEDDQLRPSFEDIKLACIATIPETIRSSNILAASALGVYLNGWTGFKIFYTSNDLVCSYAYVDLGLSGDKVSFSQEFNNVTIKGTPAYRELSGSDESGYLYSVSWQYDKKAYMLDCASVRLIDNGLDKIWHMAKDLNTI